MRAVACAGASPVCGSIHKTDTESSGVIAAMFGGPLPTLSISTQPFRRCLRRWRDPSEVSSALSMSLRALGATLSQQVCCFLFDRPVLTTRCRVPEQLYGAARRRRGGWIGEWDGEGVYECPRYFLIRVIHEFDGQSRRSGRRCALAGSGIEQRTSLAVYGALDPGGTSSTAAHRRTRNHAIVPVARLPRERQRPSNAQPRFPPSSPCLRHTTWCVAGNDVAWYSSLRSLCTAPPRAAFLPVRSRAPSSLTTAYSIPSSRFGADVIRDSEAVTE